MSELFENPKIKEILVKYRKIWALHHASSLLGWDNDVNMPRMGVAARGAAQAEISAMIHELTTSKDFVNLVESVDVDGLNDYERGVIRVLRRNIRIATALPKEHVMEMSRVSSEAVHYWAEARQKNDFSIFRDYLQKIVDLNIKSAEYLGYDEHPYDALLDLYEEGYTTRDYQRIFDKIEGKLTALLDKIASEGIFPSRHPLEELRYEEEDMKRVNTKILKLFGFPLGERSRMDVSAHPFTVSIGTRNDVRITTRYELVDFRRSLLATVHEFGHALYELQIDPEIDMTPIAGGVSSGIHESQSRFWENVIGRSREFSSLILPILRENLGIPSEVDEDSLYRYFNMVRRDFIRTEADEVTYNLHILLRFKMEKMLISGEITADEAPEKWNEEFGHLLGVIPDNYTEGILQDIHWSMGAIGYFPTYTLGTLLAAQIGHHAKEDIEDMEELISSGKFDTVKDYLREKVHRFGSTYAPKDLLKRSFGEDVEPEYYIRYIEEKYLQ